MIIKAAMFDDKKKGKGKGGWRRWSEGSKNRKEKNAIKGCKIKSTCF